VYRFTTLFRLHYCSDKQWLPVREAWLCPFVGSFPPWDANTFPFLANNSRSNSQQFNIPPNSSSPLPNWITQTPELPRLSSWSGEVDVFPLTSSHIVLEGPNATSAAVSWSSRAEVTCPLTPHEEDYRLFLDDTLAFRPSHCKFRLHSLLITMDRCLVKLGRLRIEILGRYWITQIPELPRLLRPDTVYEPAGPTSLLDYPETGTSPALTMRQSPFTYDHHRTKEFFSFDITPLFYLSPSRGHTFRIGQLSIPKLSQPLNRAVGGSRRAVLAPHPL